MKEKITNKYEFENNSHQILTTIIGKFFIKKKFKFKNLIEFKL